MTKNENNSHAFLRKMVENIKQTKDAQSPDDAKANEVHAHGLARARAKITVILSHIFIVILILLHVCFVMFHFQKLYIVCDVALFVMANKSTACHLDSPKDPVLPSKFFLVQDKARPCTLTHCTCLCDSEWNACFKIVNVAYFDLYFSA